MKAAAKRLKDLNPDCNVIEHKTIVNSSNVLDLIKDYDVVIDGTDNFPTRYCVGDACVIAKKPNVYGSIFRFEGMVTVFAPHLTNPDTGEHGPCYRCMYPEPPDPGCVPSCAEGGVIGVLPGIIGTLQANEVIKLILGIGTPAIGRADRPSARMDMEFRTFKLRRDPDCPVCGDHPTITEPIDYEQFCGVADPRPQVPGGNPARGGGREAPKRPAPAGGGEAGPVARRAGPAAGLRVQARLGGHAARGEGDARQGREVRLHRLPRCPTSAQITHIEGSQAHPAPAARPAVRRAQGQARERQGRRPLQERRRGRSSSPRSSARRASRTSRAWPAGSCCGTRT